jgi:hypothetical protein
MVSVVPESQIENARADLARDGYCRFRAEAGISSLAPLHEALDDLPPDPYGCQRNRYRRYSQAVLRPWTSELDWMPGLQEGSGSYTEYFQGDYNPEFKGIHRRFPSLTDELKQDSLLLRLIWQDFGLTSWSEGQLVRPFAVGVHIVKLLVSEPDAQAVSSPNHLHQDGEPYTFVHLLARDNAVGAANVIAPPHCSGCRPEEIAPEFIQAEFELHEPLESYGVHDRAVSHYVSSLDRGPADRPGVRAALLIDFTPLVAALRS